MKPRIQPILRAQEKHEAGAPGAKECVSPGAFNSGSGADRPRSLSNPQTDQIAVPMPVQRWRDQADGFFD